MSYDFRERIAVLGFYDADTVYAVLDQGVGIFRAGGMDVESLHSANAHDGYAVTLKAIRHRCALIQAPEKYPPGKRSGPVTPEYLASLAYAQSLVTPGVYECTTYKADDTFDRPLVDLHLPDGSLFSDRMLVAGMAVQYR
jgi:endonuclease YncB( thermonuclease family)